jgi:hypothetical protein
MLDTQRLVVVPDSITSKNSTLIRLLLSNITLRVVVADVIVSAARRRFAATHILSRLPDHLSKVPTVGRIWRRRTAWRLITAGRHSVMLIVIVSLLLTDPTLNSLVSRGRSSTIPVDILAEGFTRAEGIIQLIWAVIPEATSAS